MNEKERKRNSGIKSKIVVYREVVEDIPVEVPVEVIKEVLNTSLWTKEKRISGKFLLKLSKKL